MKRIIGGVLLAVAAAVLTCGCGGINASKSFSPLDLILPGLTQNTPSTPDRCGTNGSPLLAVAPAVSAPN